MDKSYTFAPLNGHDDALKDIAKLENELSQKVGEGIVLIAYSKKGSNHDNPFTSI